MTQEQFQKLIAMSGDNPSAIALSNLANQVGTFADPSEPFWSVNPFALTTGIGVVTNGQQITLNLDYDLYCYAIALAPYTVHTTTPFSFQLKTQAGQVLFANGPIRSDALWSDARPVFFMHNPFKILKGVNMTADFTNLTAATNNIQVVLLCWKSNSAFPQQ